MGTVGIAAVFLLSALILITDLTSAQDYMLEEKSECHYNNGTERVRFLRRYFYNQEEFVYFDSDIGKYIAKTELGRFVADQFNSDKEWMEYEKNNVQSFCVHNYGVLHTVTADRRVKPSVKISVMASGDDLYRHKHSLICNVYGFYPVGIEVKWFRNEQEQTTQVSYSGPHPDGDWTNQLLVDLETEIQKGDKFTCEIHHRSLESPLRVEWKPETPDSAKNKMVTGIIGFVLGAIFIVVGLVLYLRSQKATSTIRVRGTEAFIPN
ncbi:H-2 class II histocompatibility antigen, E-S beta chain-like isoform X1 [Pelobates fuscus]|uniref:H-2 class II histocompatibility antigen, E-S beta chain-like isoform X1 n=1 Tax=Pelobates fuscus TaxID=191477 RepID=UPI002FE44309